MRNAAFAIAIVLVSPAALADPFSDLTSSGDACFRRHYDAAHLRKNSRQQTTSILVWIKAPSDKVEPNVGLALTRRGDPKPLFVSAGCEWGDAKPPIEWMPTFKKPAGAACITLAVPDVFDVSSAQEGSPVMLDPAPDGKTITVHLGDHQVMVKRANRANKIEVKLGAGDRVFLLRRTDAKACDFVREAVTAPEPGVRQR